LAAPLRTMKKTRGVIVVLTCRVRRGKGRGKGGVNDDLASRMMVFGDATGQMARNETALMTSVVMRQLSGPNRSDEAPNDSLPTSEATLYPATRPAPWPDERPIVVA